MGRQGIIVFAHGSRDPQWHRPVEAVAERIRRRQPQALVTCAYLELSQPELHAAVAAMVDAGASRIRLLPMFLGVGKHLREDLPRLLLELAQAHPALTLEMLPPAGEDPRLLDLLAEMAG
jgi:sirohydrochlorin cobaltochelatase